MTNPDVANMILPDETGRVLLLHKADPDIDWWEFPGGKIEPPEDVMTAAVRECKEELGIRAKALRELGKVTLRNLHGGETDFIWIQGMIENGIPQTRESIHVEVEYVDLSQFNRGFLDLSPSVNEFARRLKNGELTLDI